MDALIYNGSGEVYYTVRHVKFTASVMEIPEESFFQCSMLFIVELNEGLKIIGRCAFDQCTSLKYINFPSTLTLIKDSAFNGCKSLESLDLPTGLETISPYTFSNCESLVNVCIPSSVTKIEKAAFSGCMNLKSVKLQEGLEVIGTTAFYRCEAMKRIVIPSSVKKIEKYAFERCRNLISVELSEGIEVIEDEAFAGCHQLRNLAIPSTVIKLGKIFKKLKHREPPSHLAKVFPNDDEDCNLLINALKTRFIGQPIHELCYFQAHYPTATTLNKVYKAGINRFPTIASFFSSIFGIKKTGTHLDVGTHHDVLGMTPFHIVALSNKPNIHLFQVLLRQYTTNVLLSKDLWGNSCFDYMMLMNAEDPDSGAMIKVTFQVILADRIKWLGLKRWRDAVLRYAENFPEGWEGGENRQQQLHRIYSTLSKFERLEIMSLLEIVLWKMEMSNTKIWQKGMTAVAAEGSSLSVRQISRVHCGASIVIPNVLSFLN